MATGLDPSLKVTSFRKLTKPMGLHRRSVPLYVQGISCFGQRRIVHVIIAVYWYEFNCFFNPYLQALVTMTVTPRWLLVNSTIEFPKFKIHCFCQHPQSNSRGLLIPLHAPCTTEHGGGYCTQPPRSTSHGKQASPSFWRVHGPRAGALEFGRQVHWSGVLLGAGTVEPLPSKTDCIKVSYMRSSYLSL